MQHKHLQFGQGFKVVVGDEHPQAAQLTLAPGEIEGGPDNRHRGADQWLFVVAGTGEAVVNGEATESNLYQRIDQRLLLPLPYKGKSVFHDDFSEA